MSTHSINLRWRIISTNSGRLGKVEIDGATRLGSISADHQHTWVLLLIGTGLLIRDRASQANLEVALAN